jgi:hypothetical protein
VKQLCIWFYWRGVAALYGSYPRGTQEVTPVETLGLQPGEWVEVKPLREIAETLDSRGRNRGLHFTPEMRKRCGQRYCVKGRTSNTVVEGTGGTRSIKNTVLLEGATYEEDYSVFGGCPRRQYQYWREIWLSRI